MAKQSKKASKVTRVELQVAGTDTRQEFTLDHAERILQRENTGGWGLPSNSPFKFTKKDGLSPKSSKAEN